MNEPVMNRALLAAIFQVLAIAGLAVSPALREALMVLILAAVPVATLLAGALARRKVQPVEAPRNPSNRA